MGIRTHDPNLGKVRVGYFPKFPQFYACGEDIADQPFLIYPWCSGHYLCFLTLLPRCFPHASLADKGGQGSSLNRLGPWDGSQNALSMYCGQTLAEEMYSNGMQATARSRALVCALSRVEQSPTLSNTAIAKAARGALSWGA